VRREHIIRARGTDHILGRRTWIMGVLNITPDSFSDGGLFYGPEQAVEQGLKLIEQGADILDIGGESSRPGSEPVGAEEEKNRILPVLEKIRRQSSDALISVDTTKAEVARAALDAGADIINDISAGRFDTELLKLAAERRTPIILMHMLGIPKTMQADPHYENLLEDIKAFFRERIATAVSLGMERDNIILDPGIGFGKRHQDNLNLLKNLKFLDDLQQPVLVGVSRKSFIGRILDSPPDDRLEGTIASALISVLHGAHILRVHDVAAVLKAIKVTEAIMHADMIAGMPEREKESTGHYA
jgi:dihydropteroate synthase